MVVHHLLQAVSKPLQTFLGGRPLAQMGRPGPQSVQHLPIHSPEHPQEAACLCPPLTRVRGQLPPHRDDSIALALLGQVTDATHEEPVGCDIGLACLDHATAQFHQLTGVGGGGGKRHSPPEQSPRCHKQARPRAAHVPRWPESSLGPMWDSAPAQPLPQSLPRPSTARYCLASETQWEADAGQSPRQGTQG